MNKQDKFVKLHANQKLRRSMCNSKLFYSKTNFGEKLPENVDMKFVTDHRISARNNIEVIKFL